MTHTHCSFNILDSYRDIALTFSDIKIVEIASIDCQSLLKMHKNPRKLFSSDHVTAVFSPCGPIFDKIGENVPTSTKISLQSPHPTVWPQ